MFSVTFVIEETTVSWKRARQRGKQYFVDDKTRAWKDSVAQAFRETALQTMVLVVVVGRALLAGLAPPTTPAMVV